MSDVARFSADPTEEHWAAVKLIIDCLRWLPTVTVQLNIDESLRYQNDLAFRFLMLKNR